MDHELGTVVEHQDDDLEQSTMGVEPESQFSQWLVIVDGASAPSGGHPRSNRITKRCGVEGLHPGAPDPTSALSAVIRALSARRAPPGQSTCTRSLFRQVPPQGV